MSKKGWRLDFVSIITLVKENMFISIPNRFTPLYLVGYTRFFKKKMEMGVSRSKKFI